METIDLTGAHSSRGMNPLIGYGLISGIGSLGSSLFGSFMGQKQSKELMDYQFKLQQEAIDRANLYNSPQEQMKRLAAAGLNPNLVYGSGVDGNQSQPASPAIANRRVDMQNPLQDLGQAYLQNQQLNIEKQRLENENRTVESNVRLNMAREAGQLLQNEYLDESFENRLQMLLQKLFNAEADEALTWSKTRNEDARLEQIWASTDLTRSRQNLTDEQAATELIRRGLFKEQTNYLQQKILESSWVIKRIAAEIPFIKSGTDLRQLQKEIQDLAFEAEKPLLEWLRDHPNYGITDKILTDILSKIATVTGLGGDVAKMIK